MYSLCRHTSPNLMLRFVGIRKDFRFVFVSLLLLLLPYDVILVKSKSSVNDSLVDEQKSVTACDEIIDYNYSSIDIPLPL